MGDELIDLCDENNNLTGEQLMKSVAHAKGLWHRATHVWIYNSKGEVMLQFRARDKLLFPAVWDVLVGGHVSAGEEVIISTLRETKEEVGISSKREDFEFIKVKKSEIRFEDIDNKEFIYVYLLRFDGDINNLSIQEEELEKIQFFSLFEVEELVKKGSKYIITDKEYWQEIREKIEGKIR